MSLKGEKAMLKVCGECVYASRRPEPDEIWFLTRKIHFKQRYLIKLILSGRYAKPLRGAKVFCRRENINVCLLDEVYAFWRPIIV